MWTAVLLGSLGCYALKLVGLSVPRSILAGARVRRIADLLPIAMLATLVGVQTFTTGTGLTIDARAAGVTAALLAVLVRAPFLLVVVVAVVVTAAVRLIR